MSIAAIPSVSNFSALATVGSAPAASRLSIADQAPLVATPSAIVTLGSSGNASTPVLYNAAGLLQALLQSGGASEPAAGTSQLQDDLATVLGLNTGTTGAGIPDATGSLTNLSADTVQALGNVLGADLNATGSGDANQALSDLLSQALSFSASGLDNPTATANVLNAAGVFQGSVGSATTTVLDSLLSSNLGLAATALDANTASATALAGNGVLQGSDLDSAFGGILAANVELATAGLNSGATSADSTTSSNSGQSATDILLANLNLSAAAAGTGNDIANTIANATGPTQTPAPMPNQPADLALQALSRISAGLSAEANASDAVTATVPGTTSDVNPTVGSAQTPPLASPTDGDAVPGSTAFAAANTSASTADSATNRLQTLFNDPTARAIFSVTRDPSYASAAAALYLSAAIFRFQSNDSGELPSINMPARTVTGIQHIPALKAV